MRDRSKHRVLAAFLTLGIVLVMAAMRYAESPGVELPAATTSSNYRISAAGMNIAIVDGAAYLQNQKTGKWLFHQKLYEPDFFAKNYRVAGEEVYRIADGKEYRMLKQFESGFEDADKLPELLNLEHGWTEVTLQSPNAQTVADYVALRQRILKGESDFIDNRVEPSGECVHTGKKALKTVSVAPSFRMVCAKASLETELLHFQKGDDFWVSGWFFVKEGMPLTILDVECSWIEESPGIRLMIKDGNLCAELKWAAKNLYPQAKGKEIPFPSGQWVEVAFHFTLTEKDDGVIDIWQDGRKIVETHGQTLPLPEAIYNRLEVGISATQAAATMFVDDIRVSNKPLK